MLSFRVLCCCLKRRPRLPYFSSVVEPFEPAAALGSPRGFTNGAFVGSPSLVFRLSGLFHATRQQSERRLPVFVGNADGSVVSVVRIFQAAAHVMQVWL